MDDHDSTAGTAPSPGPTVSAVDEPVDGTGARNQTSAFLAGLAEAMHAAAGHERERIAATVADDAIVHVERTQARAATEIEELRRLAEEDVERIHAWSAAEIERIQAEDTRRTDERRADLAAYLEQHDAIIATEVEGVHAAVREYRATLDAYFEALIASSNPAEIAARAGSLPPPPDLDAVRAAARSGAVAKFAEPADDGSNDDSGDSPGASALAGSEADDGTGDPDAIGVGVMDPDAIGVTAELPGEPVDDPTLEPTDEAPTGNDSEVYANSAVRLLRTIAPWTAPTVDAERRDSTTPTH